MINILISTTTNWNPGDDFIRYGVKNIVKQIIKEPINWIHYDRNPDYFVDYPSDWRMSKNHHSNVMNNNIMWDKIDLVVLAGSPEFLHGPLEPIYEGLSYYSSIPMLGIGVGYSEPNWTEPLTDKEISVLKRQNTLLIVRQEDLQKRLQKELSMYSECLPCPAIFCGEITNKSKETLLIRQGTKGKHPISKKDFESTKPFAKNADWLVHFVDEITDHTKFSSDPREVLDIISKYRKVYSNRLHGAVAALAFGSNVKLINTSHRVNEASKLFNPIWETSDVEKIKDFKKSLLEKYKISITQFLKKEQIL